MQKSSSYSAYSAVKPVNLFELRDYPRCQNCNCLAETERTHLSRAVSLGIIGIASALSSHKTAISKSLLPLQDFHSITFPVSSQHQLLASFLKLVYTRNPLSHPDVLGSLSQVLKPSPLLCVCVQKEKMSWFLLNRFLLLCAIAQAQGKPFAVP